MAQPFVTKDNFSTLIQILIWLFLIISALSVAGRTGTKAAFVRTVKKMDDNFIHTSLLLSIGQSIAVSIAASNGLGKHLLRLKESQIHTIGKAQYTAEFLWLGSLCLSRLAVLGFTAFISPVKEDQIKVFTFGAVLGVWTFAAIFVTAFQCNLPQPWAFIRGQCLNKIAWWTTVDVLNIIMDLGLIALPAIVLWKVQAAASRKLLIIFFFTLRISVVAASICNIVFRLTRLPAQDITLELWPVIVCTQAVQCLSIVSVCVLYLKPFLESLESGFTRADDMRRRGNSQSGSYGSYGLSSYGSSKRKGSDHASKPNKTMGTQTSVTGGKPGREQDRESQESQSNLIREERTWMVAYAPESPQGLPEVPQNAFHRA